MGEVNSLLRTALAGEPPLGFDVADVIARARAVRRRRRRLAAATALATGAAVLTGLVAGGVVPGSRSPAAAAMTLSNLERTSFSRPARVQAQRVPAVRIGPITTANLPGLVQLYGNVGLTNVIVSSPGSWDISLSAGMDRPGKPYVNVQVIQPHVMNPMISDCTEPGVRGSIDPPGITLGACTIVPEADGATLTMISGGATAGRFTMAQALLVRADGSAIFAEDTNQSDAPAPGASTDQDLPTFGPNGTAPIVAAAPALSSSELSALVLELALPDQPAVPASPAGNSGAGTRSGSRAPAASTRPSRVLR